MDGQVASHGVNVRHVVLVYVLLYHINVLVGVDVVHDFGEGVVNQIRVRLDVLGDLVLHTTR